MQPIKYLLFLLSIHIDAVISFGITVKKAQIMQLLFYVRKVLIDSVLFCIDDDIRIVRFLKWVINTGELLDLARSSLFVEVFWVSPCCFVDRALYVYENKISVRFYNVSRHCL